MNTEKNPVTPVELLTYSSCGDYLTPTWKHWRLRGSESLEPCEINTCAIITAAFSTECC